MNALREAAQMAKRIIAERMCSDCDGHVCCWADGAFVLNAIDAALAQPEQEPVAWIGFNERGECREVFTRDMKKLWPNYPTQDMTPLYTAPPQREWQGLTDAEVRKIIDETGFGMLINVWFDKHDGNPRKVLQAIEAKLKEKNT